MEPKHEEKFEASHTNLMKSLVNVIFFQVKIQYLGHIIYKEEIYVNLDKIKKIIDW